MNDELIIIKQLPVIEEHLQRIKFEIEERVDAALSLACNESTYKDVKKARAELNARLTDFENRRKDVKKKIEEPYEQFSRIYAENVSEPFRLGLAQIDEKIAAVESEIKDRRAAVLERYFDELCAERGIDFLEFERIPVKITMSASEKSLKARIKAAVEKVSEDLKLIGTQEYKDEILLEYRSSLNISAAITTVHNRHIALEQLASTEADRHKIEEAMAEAERKVDAVMAAVPPTVEDAEKVLALSFTVRATREKLRALKEFLENGGYDYE